MSIFKEHAAKITHGLYNIEEAKVNEVATVLFTAIMLKQPIYTIGNGASASIAQHWACDYFKGCSSTNFNPQVISLSSNIPLMTAIANDVSYEDVYSYQIDRMSSDSGVLIAISSSGNSPNIVKAVESANKRGYTTIGLTGFDGGLVKKLSSLSIHTETHEYEATEDIHQAVMHTIAKIIRYKLSVYKL